MHYYKFNIADWTLHTAHLTPEEEGIYLRLVNFYYDTEQPIPKKTQSVMRRLRLGNNVDLVNEILDEFFTLDGDYWVHKRCNSELDAFHSKTAANRANGGKGGRPPAKAKPRKTQSVNFDNPDITLTINQEPLTIKQIQGLNKTGFMEWVDARKSRKKPLTVKAAEKQITLLLEYDQPTQQQIIDQSIANDWQGLFPPRSDHATGKYNSGKQSRSDRIRAATFSTDF